MEYGLIGEHLSHSFSREIHRKLAPYEYALLELPRERVPEYLERRDFRGINVTIPYKETVLPYLDVLSPEAEQIGAVNTIVNRDGRLFGYNTDFSGMRELILHAGIEVDGKKVLLLGTGGTSKTARAVLSSLGASEIIVVSRTPKPGCVTYDEAAALHRDAQILLNTTPVGMYPDTGKTPIDLSLFGSLCGVIDVIYRPLATNLVLAARERGIPASGGLYMLVSQAVYASALFLGSEPDRARTGQVFCDMTSEMQNIVLIGMPSSGKTTVGRELKKRLGKTLIDTDDEVTAAIGCPISDYFRTNGEPAFREAEHTAVLRAADRNGAVIATGGGAVLDKRNIHALRRNGVLVFLDRSPDNLCPTPDRPVASSREMILKRYEERLPLYRAAADITVDGNRSVEETADEVVRALENLWRSFS